MKVKKEKKERTEKSSNRTKKNDTTVKKKTKGKFEVRIPRIIVRNLGFKVNEDQLKKAFEKSISGINNVSIVRKEGESRGFGFITFEKLDDAQKAIQELNGRKVLGRPMALDWSLPKNIYEKMQLAAPSMPEKRNSYGIQSNSNTTKVKEEQPEDTEQPNEEEEEEDLDEDDDEEEENDEEKASKTYTHESSRDVREHRTLFVRNIPFDATEDDLKNIFSSDGQRRVLSCRLVIDPISKHPRGSAFIQFGTSDEAQECLSSPFSFRGQELIVDLALGRDELSKAKEIRDKSQENQAKHDKRNLSLANVGVILNLKDLDGNENELKKRQNLEDIKKQKLKNPLYFVSPTRLTIHNLPKTVDDKKLRQLVIDTLKNNKISMKGIVLKECRVMKTTKDAKKSLGFGFVDLSHHETALRLIEILNNNKYVFGPDRRPIVQFSVENRRALQLKEERRERLKAKQELLKNPEAKTNLSFESNKKKKKQADLPQPPQNKTRLSDIIKQKSIKEETDDSIDNNDDTMEYEDDVNSTKPLQHQKKKTKKRWFE